MSEGGVGESIAERCREEITCLPSGRSFLGLQTKKIVSSKTNCCLEYTIVTTTMENVVPNAGPPPPRCLAALAVGSVMSESAATAWIIERLEIENTKMEEEMGNMDACEEDSAGGNSGATPLWEGLWSSLPLFHFLRRERYRAHATLNLLLNLLSEALSKIFDYVGLNFLVPRHRNTSNQHQAYEIYLCS